VTTVTPTTTASKTSSRTLPTFVSGAGKTAGYNSALAVAGGMAVFVLYAI
jgi:hypothetical protein